MINDIINSLKGINGLSSVYLLEEKDRDIIRNLEDENNYGVLSCLEKEFTLLLIHNSEFREPVGEVVKKENDKIIFPGVDFPEIKAKGVISGSPKKEVHDFLVKRFNLNLKDEATLLVGFNLK